MCVHIHCTPYITPVLSAKPKKAHEVLHWRTLLPKMEDLILTEIRSPNIYSSSPPPSSTPSTNMISLPFIPMPLPIHLPKDQIHSSDNRHRIRQHMPPTNLVKCPQMRKTRRPDLTPIRPLTPIAHDKNAHLALWRFDCAISLPRRDSIPLGKEQKMMDQSFHVFLHRCPWRRRDLVVFYSDRARRHLVQALVDDA